MNKITIDCIIGIDPGKNGGIAVWRPNHKTEVIKMPDDLMDLRQWFDYMKTICRPLVFVEKVQLRPDDITDNPGKAFRVQKLLSEFEKLKMIIAMCDVPFVLVHPLKWQNGLKLRVKGEEKPERKKRYQRVAADYYPDVRATLWNADAIMIMHFGRYILHNDPRWVLENLPAPMHDRLF